MKTALLYIRVSTDEQADKGYSQRHQEAALTRYCELFNITIQQKIIEDHSAKDFNRPEFKKLLQYLKNNKGSVNLLLFTNWSRFSRNTTDSYAMIRQLSNRGVEVQAIEQPLDLKVPENKLMLAFYLAAPEVENDRRSKNVMEGMRRAGKEGHFLGKQIFGYRNFYPAGSKKIIIPDPDEAEIVRWIYNTLATGNFTAKSVHALAKKEMGFRLSKTPYQNLITNPTYAGFIRLREYGDQPAELVPARHEAIITPDIFYKVQDILKGRRRAVRTSATAPAQFPLRGFIQCESCGRMLTASSSTGSKGGKYSYYHCSAPCAVRYKAETVNTAFVQQLEELRPHPAVKALYNVILADIERQQQEGKAMDLQRLKTELSGHQERKQRALGMYADKMIDGAEYQSLKQTADRAIFELSAKIDDLESVKSILPHMNTALTLLETLPDLYRRLDTEGKRKIISSMFSGKMHFSELQHRTVKLNEVAALIYSSSKALEEIKIGQAEDFPALAYQVGSLGLEPRLF